MELLSLVTDPLIRIAPKLPEVMLNLVLGYIGIKIFIWFLGKALVLSKLPKLRGIILSLVNLTLWIILIVFLANQLGFTSFAIAISSSVLVLVFFLNTGVAPLITDAVSGIFLCADPHLLIGSKIKVGKGENATIGYIDEIDMRKVRLIDEDGNLHVLPNSVMDKEEWTVLTKPESQVKKRAAVAKEKAKKIISATLKK